MEAEARVSLLSGWQGQPYHPGWQKVLAELKRICGARTGAAVSSAPADGGGSIPTSTAAGFVGIAGPSVKTPGHLRGYAQLIAVLLVMLFVGGAGAWIFSSIGSSNQPRPTSAPSSAPAASRDTAYNSGSDTLPAADQLEPQANEVQVVATAVRPDTGVSSARAERPQSSALSATDERQPVAKLNERRKGGTSAASPKSTMQLFCQRSGRGTRECRDFLRQAGKAGAKVKRSTPKQAVAAPRKAERVNYRYSENMRLFCEGAGRGTPECRVFSRRQRSRN
jgi:hypothetical protein